MKRALPGGCDICVVGAGIVGLAVARELSRRHPGAEIVVLDRERGIARHQSGHSSGVIHAGVYYPPGSLKARLSVEGARRLYEYCDERGIRAERSGKVIVATGRRQLAGLAELERRGRANGVPGLRRIDVEELRRIEPHAGGIAALHSPATGVVDFAAVAASLATDVKEAGGRIVTGSEVRALRPGGGQVALSTARGRLDAAVTVVCAGLWADRLAVEAGADPDPRIVPFRGAYLRLRPQRAGLVRSSIYPVPDPELPFLGMHLTRSFTGDVLIGPTALLVGARDAYRLRRVVPRDLLETLAWPGTRRMMRRHWRAGAAEVLHTVSRRAVVRECRRLLPELRPGDVEPFAHAGVRAQAVGLDGSLIDDFVVSETERAVHLRNAPSPAATAALTLAELLANRVDAIG